MFFCFAMFMFQIEELDESNIQVSAPGFHVLLLPYSEELRLLKCEKTSTGICYICMLLHKTIHVQFLVQRCHACL